MKRTHITYAAALIMALALGACGPIDEVEEETGLDVPEVEAPREDVGAEDFVVTLPEPAQMETFEGVRATSVNPVDPEQPEVGDPDDAGPKPIPFRARDESMQSTRSSTIGPDNPSGPDEPDVGPDVPEGDPDDAGPKPIPFK